MIVPNLMVTDVGRSVAFYRDMLGMTLVMTVAPDRQMRHDGDGAGAAFAILEWQGGQLMLQTSASLAEDLPVFAADQRPSPGGTIYFRGLHPDTLRDRLAPEQIVKGPERSWCGMIELYLRDPDGHIICVGAPAGPPPA